MVDLADGVSIDIENPLQSPDVEFDSPDIDVFVMPVQGVEGVGGGAPHIHTDNLSTPASTWHVVHGLGYPPSALLFTLTDGDQPVETDIHHNAPGYMSLEVVWPSPEAGIGFFK